MSTQLWMSGRRFPANADSVARARVFVCVSLADHDLLYMLEDVRLSASELATNAVLHANSAFTITITGLRTKVLLEVEDAVEEGAGSARLRVGRPLEATAASGRGLQLVSDLSQEWGVNTNRPGFKTVWAAFARAAP